MRLLRFRQQRGTTMGSRREARLSLWYGVLPVLLCAAAAAALTAGLINLHSSQRAQNVLGDTARDIEQILPHIRGELDELAAGKPDASAIRLHEWIVECDEEMRHARKDFKRLLAGQPDYSGVGEEWDEVVAHTRWLVDALGAGGGYILGPSHAFQADVPLENVLTVYETALGREIY